MLLAGCGPGQLLAPTTTPTPTNTPTSPPTLTPTETSTPAPTTDPISPENASNLQMMYFRYVASWEPEQLIYASGGNILAIRDRRVVLVADTQGLDLEDIESYSADQIANGGDINGMAISPDGQTLALNVPGSTYMYDWNRTAPISELELPPETGTGSIVFSPDGQTFALGSAYADSRSVVLIDANSGDELYRFDLGQSTWGIVRAVQFSPDGKILSGSSSHNDVIRFWDIESKTEIFSTQGTSAAYSPDGQILATGNKYGTIQLWNAGSWTKITSLEGGHTDGISFLVFSPDGQILISGSAADDTACLWDVKTGNKLSTLEGVLSVAFSPDGRTLAVGTNEYLSLYQIP